ncbi:cupin domain-containing protein [Deinococcus sp.]|uniref:cupin domain-containing protein n=1 Tax=Deinococcus sp. TaxID=47478 RepID=UPI003C7D9905
MNQQAAFWKELVGRPFSRRDTVRLAVFGAVNLGVLHPAALAQGTPATPAPPPRLPTDFTLNLLALASSVVPTNVTARKGNQKAWPVLQGVSIAHVEIPSGSARAAHLHTNTAELAVILKGAARAGIQNEAKEWMELDLQEGQCVYFPLGWTHWLRNTGEGPLTAYFNYGHEVPVTVEVT